MPFIRAARNFVRNPGHHRNHPQYTLMRDTITFLLNNAVGFSNAVSTNHIIEHLRGLGHNIYREKWQIEILGYLRDNRVFIGSRIGVGIFLIATRDDALQVYNSMNNRIRSERMRLGILRNLMHQAGW